MEIARVYGAFCIRISESNLSICRSCICRVTPALVLAAVFWPGLSVRATTEGQGQKHWVGSWATSQQLVEPANALRREDLCDATLRQIVHLSLGGREVRLRLSNRFGATTLHLTWVHFAKPRSAASPKIMPASDKAITFSGSPEVKIPPHADYLSDPLSFSVAPLTDVAITVHVDDGPDDQTGHPGSRATSYVAHGNLVSADDLPNAKTAEHWYFIAGIDVVAPVDATAVVVLGDSITDGHGATTNGNDRWTDILAQRLQGQAETRNVAVLNHGIGGNHILTDGLGPNALSRVDHDVIAQPGVHYLIVLEGINDLGLLARSGGRFCRLSTKLWCGDWQPPTNKSSPALTRRTSRWWGRHYCRLSVRTITIRARPMRPTARQLTNGFEPRESSMSCSTLTGSCVIRSIPSDCCLHSTAGITCIRRRPAMRLWVKPYRYRYFCRRRRPQSSKGLSRNKIVGVPPMAHCFYKAVGFRSSQQNAIRPTVSASLPCTALWVGNPTLRRSSKAPVCTNVRFSVRPQKCTVAFLMETLLLSSERIPPDV